jgi:Fe-S-cluster containining protein
VVFLRYFPLCAERRLNLIGTELRAAAKGHVNPLQPDDLFLLAVSLAKEFPGDPASGLLDDDEEAERRFAGFANDEPCPALDPATGLCDLYEARPMTFRVFGPAVRSEDGLCVCELCFQGATDEEIEACEMNPDPDDLESSLLRKIEQTTGVHGQTIVAFC